MHSGNLTIALVFGGRSAEHEVSLRSCRSVFEAMDPQKSPYHTDSHYPEGILVSETCGRFGF